MFKLYFCLIFTLFAWASAFVGIRIGLLAYSPGALALLRFLVASLLLAAITSFFSLERKKIPWKDRFQLILLGMAGIGLYNICLNYGELSITAGLASFIAGLIPLFTILLSVLLLGERLSFEVWCGISISLFGLLLIMIAGSSGEQHLIGVLLVLCSAFMGAIYTFSQRFYLKNYHPIVITTWVMWGGTLLLCLFFPALWREFPKAALPVTATVVYMGIVPAALAYLAWAYVLQHWVASKASLFLYCLPFLTTALGFLFLSEKPSRLSLLGGIIAVCGALLAHYLQTRALRRKFLDAEGKLKPLDQDKLSTDQKKVKKYNSI